MNREPMPIEFKPVTENGMPCQVVSCSSDGVPNVAIISKVHWVTPERLALSFQFFNKTIRNVRENPHVAVEAVDVASGYVWQLRLRYLHSETDGPIFDDMDMQIEAIASATGMSGVFKLKAADIYEVLGWTRHSLTA